MGEQFGASFTQSPPFTPSKPSGLEKTSKV